MSLKQSIAFSKIKSIGTAVAGILFLSYPFLIYFVSPLYLLLGIITLTLLRAVFLLAEKKNSLNKSSSYAGVGVAFIMGLLYFWKGDSATLYYPVVMSLSMALVFGITLLYPPSLIERFARLSIPDLDADGVTYTWKITLIWCLYCLFSALVSFGTILLDDLELWTLYNGCLSYILMGFLFAGEYAYRKYRLYAKKNIGSYK